MTHRGHRPLTPFPRSALLPASRAGLKVLVRAVRPAARDHRGQARARVPLPAADRPRRARRREAQAAASRVRDEDRRPPPPGDAAPQPRRRGGVARTALAQGGRSLVRPRPSGCHRDQPRRISASISKPSPITSCSTMRVQCSTTSRRRFASTSPRTARISSRPAISWRTAAGGASPTPMQLRSCREVRPRPSRPLSCSHRSRRHSRAVRRRPVR